MMLAGMTKLMSVIVRIAGFGWSRDVHQRRFLVFRKNSWPMFLFCS